MHESQSIAEAEKNKPPTQLIKIADAASIFINRSALVFCWSFALLNAVIILNVIMRYGFSNGLIIFEEIQWHLYAVGIMFGLSYAEITNSQVRVDVVAEQLKPSTVLKWEIFGALFFALPFIFVVIYNGIPYVLDSFRVGESSNSPLGLPYRWAIKAVIPLSFSLLMMAVISKLLRNINSLMMSGEK